METLNSGRIQIFRTQVNSFALVLRIYVLVHQDFSPKSFHYVAIPVQDIFPFIFYFNVLSNLDFSFKNGVKRSHQDGEVGKCCGHIKITTKL